MFQGRARLPCKQFVVGSIPTVSKRQKASDCSEAFVVWAANESAAASHRVGYNGGDAYDNLSALDPFMYASGWAHANTGG